MNEYVKNNMVYLVEYQPSHNGTFCGLFKTIEQATDYISNSITTLIEDDCDDCDDTTFQTQFKEHYTITGNIDVHAIKPVMIDKSKPIYVYYNGNYYFTHITQNKDEWDKLMKKTYGINYEEKYDMKRYIYNFSD